MDNDFVDDHFSNAGVVANGICFAIKGCDYPLPYQVSIFMGKWSEITESFCNLLTVALADSQPNQASSMLVAKSLKKMRIRFMVL